MMSNEREDSYWKGKLTEEQYRVMREKGTERPFTGKYCDSKEQGIFQCGCCGETLFSSNEKYDSGSGWPSFWNVIEPKKVELKTDSTHGMQRTEVLCARCGAHLGHLFDDGPEPTGLRFCINSVSLNLKPEDEPEGKK